MRTSLIGFIWIATTIDIWCCQWLTPQMELNPLANLILVNFGVWGLVCSKVLGTWIATELLRKLPLFYSYVASGVMLTTVLLLVTL